MRRFCSLSRYRAARTALVEAHRKILLPLFPCPRASPLRDAFSALDLAAVPTDAAPNGPACGAFRDVLLPYPSTFGNAPTAYLKERKVFAVTLAISRDPAHPGIVGIHSRCTNANLPVLCTQGIPPLNRSRCFRLARLVALNRKQQTLLALICLGYPSSVRARIQWSAAAEVASSDGHGHSASHRA